MLLLLLLLCRKWCTCTVVAEGQRWAPWLLQNWRRRQAHKRRRAPVLLHGRWLPGGHVGGVGWQLRGPWLRHASLVRRLRPGSLLLLHP